MRAGCRYSNRPHSDTWRTTWILLFQPRGNNRYKIFTYIILSAGIQTDVFHCNNSLIQQKLNAIDAIINNKILTSLTSESYL